MTTSRLIYPALIATLAGCTTLAPNYQRPDAGVPDAWPALQAAAPASSAQAASAASATQATPTSPDSTEVRTDLAFFTDPALRRAIDTALQHNHDLRIAALNVEIAQQQYGVQRSTLWPAINASAGETARRVPATTSTTGQAYIGREYTATLGVVAYEIDLFGRLRSLRDQALEQYFATEEAQRSARLSLIAEVATAYLTLQADQDRLSLARYTFASQQTTLQLTERSHALGVASALDVSQLQTAVESARADVARYTATVAQDRNALVLLIGSPAAAAAVLPTAPMATPSPTTALPPERALSTLPDLPLGVPSDVLLQRPDVLQAERALRAANANIGAARAAFFPSITLTAQGGSASAELSDLFTGPSRTWTFAPQITLPIFNAGRNQANLKLAELERDANIALYQKAVQTALREVADALAQRATLSEQLAAQQALTDAATRAHRLADARYHKGVDSALTALDAQRTLYSAQQSLITARLSKQTNLITLYKVLAGRIDTASTTVTRQPQQP